MTSDLTSRIADMKPKVEAWKTVKAADPRYWAVWKEYQDARLLDLFIEMADEIDRLTAELEKARQALEPFVVAAKGFDHPRVKNPDEWMAYSGIGTGGIDREGAITVTHLRTAARVHAETKG